jgi:glucoamylase
MRPLEAWIEREYRVAAKALLRSMSATRLIRTRKAFGQTIVPKEGSILASPALASYDPDPDYFFHWIRDAAVAIDALRILIERGDVPNKSVSLFDAYLRFSLALRDLSGPGLLACGDVRDRVEPGALQYVRADTELRAVEGERVFGEARYNPDGTLDIIRWPRPQNDGPALRALTLLRYWPRLLPAETRQRMRELLLLDLDFTERHWHEPCFDIWEEEQGFHFYTRLVQHVALAGGASWAASVREAGRTQRYRAGATSLQAAVREHWSEADGFYRSRLPGTGLTRRKFLDAAVILAVVHARVGTGAFSVLDPHVAQTVHALEGLFATTYPINAAEPAEPGPAIGRYAGDTYYGGGPYYLTTLALAEFYYRLAAAEKSSQQSTGALHKGDRILAMIRRFTPAAGELSEQFDASSGRQTSAKNLTWSYAAFITAIEARRAAIEMTRK